MIPKESKDKVVDGAEAVRRSCDSLVGHLSAVSRRPITSHFNASQSH